MNIDLMNIDLMSIDLMNIDLNAFWLQDCIGVRGDAQASGHDRESAGGGSRVPAREPLRGARCVVRGPKVNEASPLR